MIDLQIELAENERCVAHIKTHECVEEPIIFIGVDMLKYGTYLKWRKLYNQIPNSNTDRVFAKYDYSLKTYYLNEIENIITHESLHISLHKINEGWASIMIDSKNMKSKIPEVGVG